MVVSVNVVMAAALLLRIPEISDSTIGKQIGYPECSLPPPLLMYNQATMASIQIPFNSLFTNHYPAFPHNLET
jgi:hypothetical protein